MSKIKNADISREKQDDRHYKSFTKISTPTIIILMFICLAKRMGLSFAKIQYGRLYIY